MTDQSENWKAVALTLIAELDQRINTLMDLRYSLHYARRFDHYELYEAVCLGLEAEGYDQDRAS